MKIKAIYRYDYQDSTDYYRKCYIVGFIQNKFTGVEAVCILPNGKIDNVPIKDISIIDDEYLPELNIDEHEKEIYTKNYRVTNPDVDHVRNINSSWIINFIQADKYKKGADK